MRLLVLAFVALLAPLASVSAQTRSVIEGTVKDTTAAVLPGASLTLESPELVGGAQTTVATADGKYRFTDLLPGTYTVTAALQGFQTIKRSQLRLQFGTTLTMDFALPVATVAETITVSGEAPVVDVRTAAATTKIDEELLQSLPLFADRRTAFDVFSISPGINGRSAYGGARDANGLMLDGSNTSVPDRQGTNAAVLNTNWLEEVQVVALGANAEYGEFTGVGVNFVVRNGSNNLSGLFEYVTTRNSWLSDNTGSLPASIRANFTSQEIVSYWDVTAQAGGPIKKDKVFFFSGFEYFKNAQKLAGALTPNDQKWPRFINKVNWAASKNLRIEGLLNVTKSTSVGGSSPVQRPETAATTDQPTYVWNGRATWTAGNATLLELRQNGMWYEQDIAPTAPNTKDGPAPRRDTFTSISSVNTAQYRLQRGQRHVSSAAVTRFAPAFVGGDHQFKAGIEVERLRFLEESGFPGGLSFQDFQGAPNLVVIWKGNAAEGTGTRATTYVQDKWQIGGKWTFEPGVRVTINRGSVPDRGTVFKTNAIDPRIGFAWDVAADHKTVVRAHYGRFHEPLASSQFTFMHIAGQNPQQTARVLGPNNYQITNPGTLPTNFGIDPDIAQAHMDQYMVGVERELLPNFGLKVQYIRRNWDELFAFIDTGSEWAPLQVRDPGPDGVAGNADDGDTLNVFNLANPGASFLLYTNPDDAWRRYNGVQLIAQKRFADNWQLLASYTWSRAEGSVNNNVTDNQNAGTFNDPNVAINREGRNTFDIPHEFSLRGTYRPSFWGGFNLSAVYTYGSGATWTRQATFRGLRQGNVTVWVEPRGSRRIDATNQLDLRLEKEFPLGTRARTASLYLDIFNVGNQGVVDRDRLTQLSGPNLGLPLTFLTPRWAQVAVRVRF